MICSFLHRNEELEKPYNDYCLSKVACDLICSFPEELLQLVVSTPQYANSIVSLIDNDHYSHQYLLKSIISCSNSTCFHCILEMISLMQTDNNFLSDHPEILSFIYNHLDDYDLCFSLCFYFKNASGNCIMKSLLDKTNSTLDLDQLVQTLLKGLTDYNSCEVVYSFIHFVISSFAAK